MTGYADKLLHVAVDEDHGFMYWINEYDFYQATLDGTNETHIFRSGKLNMIPLSKKHVRMLMYLFCLAESYLCYRQAEIASARQKLQQKRICW